MIWRRILLALCCALLVGSPAYADVVSPPITLRNADDAAWDLSPVHGTLLPDGSVLFTGAQRQVGETIVDLLGPKFTALHIPLPATTSPWPATLDLSLDSLPLDCINCTGQIPGGSILAKDTLFCSGHTLLDDGTVFFVSGTRLWSYTPDDPQAAGLDFATGLDFDLTYDPATQSWSRVPGIFIAPGESNLHGRWYGTATRLADSRVLITSGYDVVGVISNNEVILGTQSYNVSVEAYDPLAPANPRELLSDAASTPASIFNSDYSHVFQMPFTLPGGRDVLMIGDAGEPVFMQPTATPNWFATGQIRPGVNPAVPPLEGGSTVLLPIRTVPDEWGYQLGAIMVVGGGSPEQQVYADVYDLLGGGWQPRIPIGDARHHPSTVLLPDGRIFALGGHGHYGLPGAPLPGILITPSAAGFSVIATAPFFAPHGYHTVALLLPDGRVLVSGGRDKGATGASDEKPSLEYYEPDYFSGPRPTITAAPSEIHYGEPFAIEYSGATTAGELVLMGLGSMTHSFDANQRSVQIFNVNAAPGIDVGLLAGGERYAPPGHYMLFLLDQNRIPSEATIVRVSHP